MSGRFRAPLETLLLHLLPHTFHHLPSRHTFSSGLFALPALLRHLFTRADTPTVSLSITLTFFHPLSPAPPHSGSYVTGEVNNTAVFQPENENRGHWEVAGIVTLYVSMQYLDQCKNNTNSGVFVCLKKNNSTLYFYVFFLCWCQLCQLLIKTKGSSSTALHLAWTGWHSSQSETPSSLRKKASLETASNKLGTKHTTIFFFFHPVCKLCLETSNLVWGAWRCFT